MAGHSRAACGIDSDFETTFNAHYPDLYRYALRRCRCAQDAEDLVAETFAVAWRRRDDLPTGDETRLWLFGTARMLRMNLHRATTRRQRLTARLGFERPQTQQPDGLAEIGDDGVGRALAALSADDREVLLLTAWEGLRSDEVATVLGISHTAARKRLERARTRFRDRLPTDHPRSTPARPSPTTATEAAR